MTYLYTILGISLLIILHEVGHYAMARAFGMRVLKFSVGFGPALLRGVRGETTWQIAAIPLGGFVQIDGMGPAEENGAPNTNAASDTNDPRSFRNKPTWQRVLVIFAGPAMNWLLAAAFIAILAGSVGVARYDQPVLGEVVADGPAAKAGLQEGDRVLRIDAQPITSWEAMVDKVRQSPGQTLQLDIERDQQQIQLNVQPETNGGSFGIIQVAPAARIEHYGPVDSLRVGAVEAWHLTSQYAGLLWGLITGQQGGSLSGLPGIVKMVSAQAEHGIRRFLEALAWLSIGLCLLNLLPFPALGGGRLLFLGVEAVRRRPVDERFEALVHTAGFVLLLALMIFVSVRDLI